MQDQNSLRAHNLPITTSNFEEFRSIGVAESTQVLNEGSLQLSVSLSIETSRSSILPNVSETPSSLLLLRDRWVTRGPGLSLKVQVLFEDLQFDRIQEEDIQERLSDCLSQAQVTC